MIVGTISIKEVQRDDLGVIDEYAKAIGTNRSQIIKDCIHNLAEQLRKATFLSVREKTVEMFGHEPNMSSGDILDSLPLDGALYLLTRAMKKHLEKCGYMDKQTKGTFTLKEILGGAVFNFRKVTNSKELEELVAELNAICAEGDANKGSTTDYSISNFSAFEEYCTKTEIECKRWYNKSVDITDAEQMTKEFLSQYSVEKIADMHKVLKMDLNLLEQKEFGEDISNIVYLISMRNICRKMGKEVEYPNNIIDIAHDCDVELHIADMAYSLAIDKCIAQHIEPIIKIKKKQRKINLIYNNILSKVYKKEPNKCYRFLKKISTQFYNRQVIEEYMRLLEDIHNTKNNYWKNTDIWELLEEQTDESITLKKRLTANKGFERRLDSATLQKYSRAEIYRLVSGRCGKPHIMQTLVFGSLSDIITYLIEVPKIGYLKELNKCREHDDSDFVPTTEPTTDSLDDENFDDLFDIE